MREGKRDMVKVTHATEPSRRSGFRSYTFSDHSRWTPHYAEKSSDGRIALTIGATLPNERLAAIENNEIYSYRIGEWIRPGYLRSLASELAAHERADAKAARALAKTMRTLMDRC